MNTPKSTAEAWGQLEEKVDSFAEALIKETLNKSPIQLTLRDARALSTK
jgi:hypothetical protein